MRTLLFVVWLLLSQVVPIAFVLLTNRKDVFIPMMFLFDGLLMVSILFFNPTKSKGGE